MKFAIPSLSLAAAAMLPAAASAQTLAFSFETGATSWGATADWAAAGPATDGVASARINAVTGGWNLGSHAMNFGGSDFDGNSVTDNVTLEAIGNTGQGIVSFDIIIDHATSFPVAGGTWYSINTAANSTGGWTQFDDIATGIPGFGWHDDSSTGLLTASFTYTFDQLNWTDVGQNWYQLNFGSNSDNTRPVNFYVDNVVISAIPEPSTYASLTALIALGFAVTRSRRRG